MIIFFSNIWSMPLINSSTRLALCLINVLVKQFPLFFCESCLCAFDFVRYKKSRNSWVLGVHLYLLIYSTKSGIIYRSVRQAYLLQIALRCSSFTVGYSVENASMMFTHYWGSILNHINRTTVFQIFLNKLLSYTIITNILFKSFNINFVIIV